MATNPTEPVQNAPADQQLDDHTGVYGFFRRHQKKLLYTAGLFTLLTFSVTGPMMTMVGEWFGKTKDMPSIAVGGERVKLTSEDYQYGAAIQRYQQALPAVLPPLGTGDAGSSDQQNIYAVLRRAAITEGLDVSMVEVDRAIEALRNQANVESATRLAGYRGFGSLAQMRDLTREAMRIGNYVRLQTLALDSSDAKVLEQVLEDKEKITFRVAAFDEKAYEEQQKEQVSPSDDDLRTWLDGKEDGEKRRLQVYDTNHLELAFGALLLDEGQFDPAQWQETYLKDVEATEDQLRATYEQQKTLRFELEDGTFQPFEDVQDRVKLVWQAQTVVQKLQADLRKQLDELAKPLTEETQRCQAELGEAQGLLKEAQQALADAGDDEKEARQQAVTDAENVVTAKQAALTAAQDAIKAARAQWDFAAAFAAATEGKSGAVVRAMQGKRNMEGLKDLDAAGVDLGKWPLSMHANGLGGQGKGALSFSPAITSKAVALYQVTDVELQPMKSWDALQPLLRDAWFTEKAKQEGETRKAALADALLRLGKEKIPEQVAEIEGSLATKVDERMAEWRQKTEAGIAEARDWLQRLSTGTDGQPPTQAQIAWQKKLDTLQDQLAKQDEHRAAVEEEVRKANEAEIAAAAEKHYGEVLDAAAAEAGFTVSTVGPHPRELAQRPRFDKAFEPLTVFLFRNHAEIEADATTGVVQDATNRVWLCAVCTEVAPLEVGDVTRRQFEDVRTGRGFNFAKLQALTAYSQAFTMEALEQRYDLQQPVGQQEVPAK